jgi:adenine phosphoribosyltransferase
VKELRDLIADVPGFPKPGIIFKDITPMLRSPEGLALAVDSIASEYAERSVEVVAAVESRGFIFGTGVAYRMGVGFVPMRKPKKLPRDTMAATYDLEYGTDTIEMHADAVESGTRVLLVDDLLATGGTMEAACTLLEQVRAEIVACAFVIELDFLKGRERLAGREVFSLVHYDE